MNWVLSYTACPALASQRSVGPPRCTNSTAIGTPAASAATRTSTSSCNDTPAGFSTTSDEREADRPHLVMRDEDVRQLGVPVGREHFLPGLVERRIPTSR